MIKKIFFTLLIIFGFISVTLAHEHHPPHKGVLIVLGDEFAHLELAFDNTTGTLTAYSLDGEAENAIALAQKEIVLEITPAGGTPSDLSLKAVENPLTGETVGNTSEFSGQAISLKGAAEFFGVIESITTKGQEFKNISFNFPEGNDHDDKK